MKKTATVITVCLFFVMTASSHAQLDDVSKKASQLEADLNKLLDASPKAGQIMVELVDLYHQHGRAFGLIRTGQKFIAAQPNHPQHKQVMLKLLDGLVVMSRNKDIIATSRQFIERYPKDRAAIDVGLTLARTLRISNQNKEAASAFEDVWQRDPKGQRDAGVDAIRLYSELNNTQGFKDAARLSHEMLDKLPNDAFAAETGWQSFHFFRRFGDAINSNVVGNKIIKRNLPLDKQRKASLFETMAENYWNNNQRANAIAAIAQARHVDDSPERHRRHVRMLSDSQAKSAEMAPVADSYFKKYTDHDDRWQVLTELAYALQRDQRNDEAVQLLAKVLPHDAWTHDAPYRVAEWVKQDEAGFAQAEKILLDALGKNTSVAHQAKIRYTLTFYVYRDRMKDTAKARQTAFDLVTKSPDDSGYTSGAMGWLFNSAPDDATFQKEFMLVLKAGLDYPHISTLRTYIPGWIKNAKRNKELRARVDFASNEYDKFYDHPVAKTFATAFGSSRKSDAIDAREQLLKPANLKKLSDVQARELLSAQGYWYRHYSSNKDRNESVTWYQMLAEREAENIDSLYRYIEAASHYATEEQAGEAVKFILKQKPVRNANLWYHVMATASRSKDKELIKSAFAWVNKGQAMGEFMVYNAHDVAQRVFDIDLKDEAMAYWRKGADADPQGQYGYYCAERLVRNLEGDAKLKAIQALIDLGNDFHGAYASWLANEHFKAGDMAKFESVLRTAKARQAERPFRSWGMGEHPAYEWIAAARSSTSKLEDKDKQRVFAIVSDMDLGRTSASATLALLELQDAEESKPTFNRLTAYQRATTMAGRGQYDWDTVKPYAQSALSRKDYFGAATLLTGMLNNMTQVDQARQKDARGLVGQCYSRMGVVGMAIDENSPYAAMLQASLYLRIGDEKLAFDTYDANRAMFDQHRDLLPVDLILFVAESHMVAGGEDNHNRTEDILRGWLVKHGESKNIEDATKASVQLLLAKNYFLGKRYEVARNEFQSLMNRYPKTTEALEAEFGIGETFMAQKIYDQAEQIFEKLSNSREREVVVRAEFLRGVLAHRRGDRDEARDIFKSVLERVPDISLANLTLFNLSEVYGQEQRYIEQLELLNTVGRLGRASKRWHTPGATLSIVVQDSDLGISRGHTKIPVIVTSLPGGDQELIYLHSGGAGKGLFRGDLETVLGDVKKNDKVLQLTGKDVIRCDYPDEFKAEFKNIPLADAEIRIAADAKFDVASSKIVDEKKETFSQQLAKEENNDEEEDQRQSQKRPQNQIKPGNVIYMRVQDADRDMSDKADEIVVKLVASSGDQVQVNLTETGPHTGVFEATAKTGELPAGALASDNAIDRNPLMAIDRDPQTYWQSEPDGATPKWLSVDMKDLKDVSQVTIATPDPAKGAPVRGVLQGSHDGRFWFRLAGNPAAELAEPFAAIKSDDQAVKAAGMVQRVYRVKALSGEPTWEGVARLTSTVDPESVTAVDQLTFERPDDDARSSFFVVWQGRFVQPRDGAVRFNLTGSYTGLAVDGVVELALDKGTQFVDVWLERGVHDVAFVSVSGPGNATVGVTRARENTNAEKVSLAPFHKNDYDVNQPEIQAALQAGKPPVAKPVLATAADAELTKKTSNFGPHSSYPGKPIGYWQDMGDVATWQVKIDSPGAYNVFMNWSRQGDGNEAIVMLGDQQLDVKVVNTGQWDRFVDSNVGTIRVEKAGTYTLSVKPKKIADSGLMNLKSIALRPTESSTTVAADGSWHFQFKSHAIRYVRFVVNEYTGEAVAINHVEVKGESGGKPFIPTEADVLALASNDELEIAAGDTVLATYTDEFTFSSVSSTGEAGRNRVLARELQATYYNGKIMPVAYDFVRNSGGVGTIRKELMRVDPGDRIIIEVTDYDLDQTKERDTIEVLVSLNDADPIKLIATETGEYTGVFTKEIDTAPAAAASAAAGTAPGTTKDAPAGTPNAKDNADAKPENPIIKIKPGDRIYIRYVDRQNTFPGHSVKREAVVYANVPTDGLVRVIETRLIRPPAESKNQTPKVAYLDPVDGRDVASVAFEVPLTVEVIDPDRAKDSRSSVIVELTTTDGAKVKVNCVVSQSFSTGVLSAAYPDSRNWALEEGRFVGQVAMQLGSKDSPSLIPLTDDIPRGLVGGPILVEKMEDSNDEPEVPTGVTRVLNLTGKDRVTALYKDILRPDKKVEELTALARLISNGQLVVTDRDYNKPIEQLHVGEKVFIVVTDADLDISDERDKAMITVKTDRGEMETFQIEETLSHSGVFTGSLPLKASDKPTAGNALAASPEVETFFGDTLTITYLDKAASTETGELELNVAIPVVIGTNGLVKAFSKVFGDEKLAVETRFTIAESYFELFKSHKRLERDEQMTEDLESGKRVLREVMEDYPDPKYVPRIQYLLGQFAQELQSWDEAINAYSLIVRNHPDHALAPDAQYKLGQVYEESGNFDEAVEAYVTLAATYPNSPLISSVMIRIGDYFFKNEQFIIAANVGEKFVEKFDSHQHASKMAFRIGQCYYKAEQYDKSAEAFDQFTKTFPDDELASLALFWSGEAYRQQKNVPLAFRRYNRCRWDFPESDAAKYARGRLALPEMLQQFEREANLDNN